MLGKGSKGWAKSLKSDLRCCDEPKLPPVSPIFAGAEWAWGKGPQAGGKSPSPPGGGRAALTPWSSKVGLSLWAEFTIRICLAISPSIIPSILPSIYPSFHPSIHPSIIPPILLSTYPSNEYLLSTHCGHDSEKTEDNEPPVPDLSDLRVLVGET